MKLAGKIAAGAVAVTALWPRVSANVLHVSVLAADCGPAVVLITTYEGGEETALGSGFVVE